MLARCTNTDRQTDRHTNTDTHRHTHTHTRTHALARCRTSIADHSGITELQDVKVGLQCTRINGSSIQVAVPLAAEQDVGFDCVIQHKCLLRNIRTPTVHVHRPGCASHFREQRVAQRRFPRANLQDQGEWVVGAGAGAGYGRGEHTLPTTTISWPLFS